MNRRLHHGSLERAPMLAGFVGFSVELECTFERSEHGCVWKRGNPKNRVVAFLLQPSLTVTFPTELQLRGWWVTSLGLHESIQVAFNFLAYGLLFIPRTVFEQLTISRRRERLADALCEFSSESIATDWHLFLLAFLIVLLNASGHRRCCRYSPCGTGIFDYPSFIWSG